MKTENNLNVINKNLEENKQNRTELGNGCYVAICENLLNENNAMIGIEDENFNLLTPAKFNSNFYRYGNFVLLKCKENYKDNKTTLKEGYWTVFNTKTKSFVCGCKFDHVEASPDLCIIDFYEGINSYTLNLVDGSFVFNNTISNYMLKLLTKRPSAERNYFAELDNRYFMENDNTSKLSLHKTKILCNAAKVGLKRVVNKAEQEKIKREYYTKLGEIMKIIKKQSSKGLGKGRNNK